MPLYQGGGLTARRNAAGHAVEAAQSTIQRTRLDVRQKRTAIIIASLKKHYACVEFLIAAGADIDKQDQT
ncbi:hypothetical protein, partial [Enterobacter kobei]|uniref:hypothetical protein n=1 Tax=Enterobacter kobei TaxID=208224 RepID=UPI003EE3F875